MKRIVFYFLFLTELLVFSCTKEAQQPLAAHHDSFVSLESIRNYVGPKTKSGDANETVITTYGDINNTPLLYIVNYGYGDGWQILSSDSRTPAVVAEGENGYFSLEEGSPAVRIWMDRMAADMAAVRVSTDEQLTFTKEQIAANKAVWGEEGNMRVLPQEGEGGNWHVSMTSSEYLVEEVAHMTPHRDQYAPYNAYCPLKVGSTYDRAPVGCVAVAAAGVLYYLHNEWNIPAGMVDYGVCEGDISDYSRTFDGNSTTIWSQMSYQYNVFGADAEALMLGYVGDVLGMHYWSGENNYYFSWAFPSNIRTILFAQYNISCSQGDYYSPIVKNNLGNHMPVIVTASDWEIPINGDIHCFVIDGFKKTFIRYTYYHYWVEDDPHHSHSTGPHDPYYTYEDTEPEVTAIKINWGWASQWDINNPVNDGWYSLTADWTVTNNGSTFSYNHNVNMIYDITLPE